MVVAIDEQPIILNKLLPGQLKGQKQGPNNTKGR